MTEIITEQVLINEDANYEVNVSIAWTWVDNGIGSYEFWGTPGVDVRMELEFDGFYIDSVVFDEEFGGGVSWTMTQEDKEHHPELWKSVEEWVEAAIEELDPPEADYYDDEYYTMDLDYE